MSGFNEHKVMLCLDTDLYLAFVKLQADKGLGRAYAGLLPYVEGLYRMGYITEDVYKLHVERYSEPLKEKKPWTSLEDKQQKEAVNQVDKTIRNMIDQFETHKKNPAWLKSVKAYAERFPKLDSSKTLLGMIEKAIAVTVATVKEDPEATELKRDLEGMWTE